MSGFQPAVEETHISVLFLLGDRVFKLKKAIQLPFLDWRDRDVRRAMCHQEVALNRRLAPDVYLGVVDVVAEDGRPIDHLVEMRRMPDDRRLRNLVQRGADVGPGLDQLAELLVRFHGRADRTAETARWAGRDVVRQNWEDNLVVLEEHAAALGAEAATVRIAELARRYLDGRELLFAERARAGLHVDGHGDLLADDIYLLDDGPRVLDCLEFSSRLRAVDVLDDVAFLVMDLEHLGASEAGEAFLSSYLRRSAADHPSSLLDHYVAYRAGVRAKVACLRADQDGAVSDVAGGYLDLALRHLERGRVRLVLLGGLPGTGKSTLAGSIADATGWTLLRSDVVRKELAGVKPTTSMAADYGEGIYDAAHTEATYAALLDQATRRLQLGQSVILDATWRDPALRAAAERVAAATSSDLERFWCSAPTDVAIARLRGRDRSDPSDATPEVAMAMATDAAPWEEAVTLDTTRPADANVAAMCAALGWQA